MTRLEVLPGPARRALLVGFLAGAALGGCDGERPTSDDTAHPSGDALAESAPPCAPAGLPTPDEDGRAEVSDRYRLTADSVRQQSDLIPIQLVKVELALYDSVGAEVARLTSEHGEYDSECESLVARGKVVLESADRTRRLQTEELHYLPGEDRLWSPVRSLYLRRGTEIVADSFVSDGQFQNVTTWGAAGRFSTRSGG